MSKTPQGEELLKLITEELEKYKYKKPRSYSMTVSKFGYIEFDLAVYKEMYPELTEDKLEERRKYLEKTIPNGIFRIEI